MAGERFTVYIRAGRQHIASWALSLASLVYRDILLLHIASLPHFKHPTSIAYRTPELVPSAVPSIWAASDRLCRRMLLLPFIFPLLFPSNAIMSTAAVTSVCCTLSLSLSAFMRWHISIASNWSITVGCYVANPDGGPASHFSATHMLLAAPVAWAAWASISASTMLFLVGYTGSLSVAVERYAELVHDLQDLMDPAYMPGGAAPIPSRPVFIPGMLAVLAVIFIGTTHAGFVVVHFSRLGLSLIDGDCEGRLSSPNTHLGAINDSLAPTDEKNVSGKSQEHPWELDICMYYSSV